MIFCRLLLFFSKSIFSKKYFRNLIRVLNILDSDLALQNVRPDLGPNCLQWLSADDTSWQRVELNSVFHGCIGPIIVLFFTGSLVTWAWPIFLSHRGCTSTVGLVCERTLGEDRRMFLSEGRNYQSPLTDCLPTEES